MKDHDITEQAFKNGYEKGKQEVAREIFDAIDDLIWDYDTHPCRELRDEIAELEKKYIGR